MKTLRPCLAEFLSTFYLWLAPIAGACAAALVYEHVLLRPMKPAVNEPRATRA